MSNSFETLKPLLADIRIIVTDVDGVLTPGLIHIHSDGTETKTFCAKDAPRILAATENGIDIIFFSGRKSAATCHRASELEVKALFKSELEESEETLFQYIQREYSLSPKQVLYVGDDWNDLPYMKYAGISATPKDGHAFNQTVAHIVTESCGGEGVLSELIEMVLKAQGKFSKPIQRYYIDSIEPENR